MKKREYWKRRVAGYMKTAEKVLAECGVAWMLAELQRRKTSGETAREREAFKRKRVPF